MMAASVWRKVPRQAVGAASGVAGSRALPEEVAVAISYNGTTQAVLMATPDDLEDFGHGFSLTEGIAAPQDIDSLDVQVQPRGIEVQIWLKAGAGVLLADRRRTMTGPVGCGLCGIDSIAQALRAPVPVPQSALRLTEVEVSAAMALLPTRQVLHDVTRAVHGAAFYRPGAGIVLLREDVGRHNALDKLAGAMVRAGIDAGQGAILLTSRVSIDLVQKACAMGAPVLIGASAPTAAAVDMAETAGLTLIALARGDAFEMFTHPQRILTGAAAHVA